MAWSPKSAFVESRGLGEHAPSAFPPSPSANCRRPKFNSTVTLSEQPSLSPGVTCGAPREKPNWA